MDEEDSRACALGNATDPGRNALWMTSAIARLLGRGPDEISRASHFEDLGMDSSGFAMLAEEIEQRSGVSVGLEDLYDNPTIESFAVRLAQLASHGSADR